MKFLCFVTRRALLQWTAAAGASTALPLGCYGSSGTYAGGFFRPDERRALGALADVVLPPDDAPGGGALGAAEYVERLLTAFDSGPPAIFAGGPYSGRQPFSDGNGHPSSNYPPNDFATWTPLDRVSERAWRLRLYGSNGVDGGGPNDAITGVVVGLREQVKSGLSAAMAASPAPLETLDPETLRSVFSGLDPLFRDTFIELVIEAAFSAPEYGGNKDLAGWKLAHYEGDSQPLGYSVFDDSIGDYRERPEAPMSTANPGPDPAPLDDATRAFLEQVVSATGGKVFR